jgi:hypothetical protein
MPVMTWLPTWKFMADTHILKLQRLQNKLLLTTGKFSMWTPVRNLHVAIHLLYVYDYVTKLCRQQVEMTRDHENEHVRSIGQDESRHRKYKWLKLGGGQAYDRSSH